MKIGNAIITDKFGKEQIVVINTEPFIKAFNYCVKAEDVTKTAIKNLKNMEEKYEHCLDFLQGYKNYKNYNTIK